MIKARVTITLKKGVLDPQGKATEDAIRTLGFDNIQGVRQGKVFDLELTGDDKIKAEANIEAICKKLLANMVIEDYKIETG